MKRTAFWITVCFLSLIGLVNTGHSQQATPTFDDGAASDPLTPGETVPRETSDIPPSGRPSTYPVAADEEPFAPTPSIQSSPASSERDAESSERDAGPLPDANELQSSAVDPTGVPMLRPRSGKSAGLRDAYVNAFDGDISVLLSGEPLPSQMAILVRKYVSSMGPDGKMSMVIEHVREVVSPGSSDLTPAQRLGVAVELQEKAIRELQAELMKTEDKAKRDKILDGLREAFEKRFEVDTAFQDYKVREIERRAKKLRAEVTAREQAADEWVEAMVTLAKMHTKGIQTMNVDSTVAQPTQLNGPYINRPPRGTSLAAPTTQFNPTISNQRQDSRLRSAPQYNNNSTLNSPDLPPATQQNPGLRSR